MIHSAPRVVYFGSGAFGLPTLAMLAARTDVAAVVSQPARPAGRGGKPAPTPIAAWCVEHRPHVPLLTPASVNDADSIVSIRGFGADAWVVAAFGQKLGAALLEDQFAVNLHASRLPRWRGASPVQAAILAGDSETGNSVITLAERIDAGLVLAQSRITIDPSWTAGDLERVLADDGPGLVWDVLERHAAGTLVGRHQDPALVTRAPKLSKADAWMRFEDGAEACRRRIHGLNPWPGVTASIAGQDVKLSRAAVVESAPGEAEQPVGMIVDVERGEVACRGGARLRLIEVHPAGGRRMTWVEFVRGRRIKAGEMIRISKV